MEHREEPGPAARPDRGRALPAALVAAGAAVAMTFAGLGMAGAQTGDTTTTTTTAPAVSDEAAPHREHHCRQRLHRHPAALLSPAAEAIGISETDLRTALGEGRSIAQVAESRGVAVQKVVDALVAEVGARLAEKVQAGRLTQAQADEKEARLTERITALVSRPGAQLRHRGTGERRPAR